ncbi:hypothetical protein TNCV_552061 [Trichonephila clavipes]|nr:hypothetical protein TNCV_552061 [Trichonephila clavipes]
MSFTRRPVSGSPRYTSHREDLHIARNVRVQPTASLAAFQAQDVLQFEIKGGNSLGPGPDHIMDALKLHSQAPRYSGESLQTCVAWYCSDGTHLFCWPILAVFGQSLASNGPVVDSRYLNLVLGHAEAIHIK